jgi:2'-5' RNA ligase
MLALMLTPEQTAEITEGIPGRLAKEADHCTLIYLAQDAAAIEDRKAALLSSLAVLASMTEPVEVAVNGYGAFAGDDEQYPLVMLLNSPQLPWLRQAVYMRASGLAIPLEDRYGFTPHITLCYLPASTPMPRLERKRTPLRFEAISLVWAGERIDLPLLGKQPLAPHMAGEISTEKAPAITTKPFASRAQQRWAFSTGQPFAERWADETGDTAAFRRLPERVARKSKSAQRRLAAALKAESDEGASGRPAPSGGRGYSARAGETIRGNLKRGADGKFTSAGSASGSKPFKLDLSGFPDKKKKPKKGGSKGSKPKKSDAQKEQERLAKQAQREAERDAKRRENEKAVGDGAGLGASLSDALLEFASPDENITLAPQNAEALLAKGLVEKNPDGSYRISGAGRSYIAAARTGDVSKARDALGRGEQRAQRRREIEERRAAREAARNAKEQGKDPKEAKPKKGGGGGKGKDEKPSKNNTNALRNISPAGNARPASGGSSGGPRNSPEKPKQAKPAADERAIRRDQDRRATARDTARKVGISPDDYSSLRAAAETGGGNDALARLGFTSGGEATDQGRRALTALERGDVRGYQAALQDARNRMARERATAERRAAVEARRRR